MKFITVSIMSNKVMHNYAVGTVLLLISALLNHGTDYSVAILLMTYSIVSYIHIVYYSEMNWLDIRAVFSFIWLLTIGLASLRLADYQEVWQRKTWILLAVAYGLFPLGVWIGEKSGAAFYKWTVSHRIFSFKKNSLSQSGNRLFIICISTTMVSIMCLIAAILVRGTLPFFSSDPFSYITFYTKFHVFSVAGTAISGLCYYIIKTYEISKLKKTILYLCILYSTFVFPILVVSRGVFITSAIMLTTAIFYLNKKKLWVLLCCVVIMMGTYMYVSSLRKLPDTYLDKMFEPSDIPVSETESSKIESVEYETFKLSPQAAFLYSYLTVSHDNFNEAVQNSKRFSYGVRQFTPFNVIFRLPVPEIEKSYLVREHLNTHNFISDAYYDFREIGVIILMLFWPALFGAIQAFYLSSRGPFGLMTLGNTVSAVALSFFVPWMSNFTHWLLWGTIFLLFLVYCGLITPKNQKKIDNDVYKE